MEYMADWGAIAASGPSAYQAGTRVASYVDKIVKGAKPGDLPIEPVDPEFVVNLKAAACHGVTGAARRAEPGRSCDPITRGRVTWPSVKIILAMAVGPSRNMSIRNNVAAAGKVRPYIAGLIAGLKSAQSPHRHGLPDRLSRASATRWPQVPGQRRLPAGRGRAVRPDFRHVDDGGAGGEGRDQVDADRRRGFGSEGRGTQGARNVTGISARRSQSADRCLESFLATVPSIEPALRAAQAPLRAVGALAEAGAARSPRSTAWRSSVVAVKTRADIDKPSSASCPSRTPRRRRRRACWCFRSTSASAWRAASSTWRRARSAFRRSSRSPTASPPSATSALGGRGVPQRRCGELMADYVHGILWRGKKASALKIADVGDDEFEWVVSSKAARALNVNIPHVV